MKLFNFFKATQPMVKAQKLIEFRFSFIIGGTGIQTTRVICAKNLQDAKKVVRGYYPMNTLYFN